MHKSILRSAGIAAAVALLAGCTGAKTDNCPTLAALLDASSLTVFRQGTSPDPANVLYNVRIIDVSGKCDFNKKEVVGFRCYDHVPCHARALGRCGAIYGALLHGDHGGVRSRADPGGFLRSG